MRIENGLWDIVSEMDGSVPVTRCYINSC